MEKIRKKDLLLLIGVCAFLALGGLSLLLFPAPRYSATENRMLAEKPKFSLTSLANGSYTAAWESYTAERIAGRRVMRGAHAALELMLGKGEANGVILCRDGSLSKRLTVNEHVYRKNLKAIAKYTALANARGTTLTVAVAPRRMDARAAVLPRLYRAREDPAPYQTLRESLPDALVFDALTKDADWYRTDHHWTTAGAYKAYRALGNRLGFIPYEESAFSKETVSEAFWGTSDAACGLLGVAPDTLTLWRTQDDQEFSLLKDGKPAAFAGLYDLEKRNTRDGYAVFLGGNDGVIEVKRGQEDTRPTLLVIKDSFANAVIPFLAHHFHIIAVDPRYTAMDIGTYFEEADQVLLLWGMQTLSEVGLF